MSNSLDERTLHNREGKRAKTSNNVLLFLAYFYVSVHEGQKKGYDSYRIKNKKYPKFEKCFNCILDNRQFP